MLLFFKMDKVELTPQIDFSISEETCQTNGSILRVQVTGTIRNVSGHQSKPYFVLSQKGSFLRQIFSILIFGTH